MVDLTPIAIIDLASIEPEIRAIYGVGRCSLYGAAMAALRPYARAWANPWGRDIPPMVVDLTPIEPEIRAIYSSGHCSLYGAAMAALRPYAHAWAAANAERLTQEASPKALDQRRVMWHVSMILIPQGASLLDSDVVMTDGRTVDLDRHNNIPITKLSYGDAGAVDAVSGLAAVADLVRQALKDNGYEPDEFGNLRASLDGLRPTISRQRGCATMRRRNQDGANLWVDVVREDAWAALPDTPQDVRD